MSDPISPCTQERWLTISSFFLLLFLLLWRTAHTHTQEIICQAPSSCELVNCGDSFFIIVSSETYKRLDVWWVGRGGGGLFHFWAQLSRGEDGLAGASASWFNDMAACSCASTRNTNLCNDHIVCAKREIFPSFHHFFFCFFLGGGCCCCCIVDGRRCYRTRTWTSAAPRSIDNLSATSIGHFSFFFLLVSNKRKNWERFPRDFSWNIPECTYVQ